MFYCREKELKFLTERYEGNSFECIVIYGRRRVGKTALINEFAKDKAVIYFSAVSASIQENLQDLSRVVGEYKHYSIDDTPMYSSFDAAMNEIIRLSKEDKIIFVIDEYPYLAKAQPAISSKLQHLIDHRLSDSNLFMILCGSSMSFMENQVLGYESPLYGRRTGQIKLHALTYKETAAFNPQLTNEENAIIYGITGGIPHYINKLNVKDNLDEAIIKNFFMPSSYLFEEPDNLLKQELRNPATYNSIISAIANGASRLNEIATKVNLATGSCTQYINVLIDLGILKKETPITEKAGKHSIYQICDNFFKFWYYFVPKYYSAINSGRIEHIYYNAIKPKIHEYMGDIFEKMCRDYLMLYDDTPICISDIGQWWGTDKTVKKEVQIDIVGVPLTDIGEDTYIIGSCKFRNKKIDVDELELIKHYAKVFGKGNGYIYYIFSLGGFTEALEKYSDKEKVHLRTLEDMF